MEATNDKVLSHATFWDQQYLQSDGSVPTHEWYRSFLTLEPFFALNLFNSEGFAPQDEPLLLHLGSGDSTIPVELAARGYKYQLCVDFSSIVVKLMKERHAGYGIEWRWMDVRDMKTLEDASVDVAFDKGTLDAMIHGSPWSPPKEVKDNTSAYLREVHRVLKNGGQFLCVTFRQPHFMNLLLNPDGLWTVDRQVLSDDTGLFDYYGYVMRKAQLESRECKDFRPPP
ncbi:S-adenosyl-L-methionine-dependent methyltransferase [Cercophora newfieldiana]|uniref:S-adenosyl-L-methionine-dependent methyltransferase n=1 Tax=Cercophora newfieldiana TaxID=92897 RepID=A0AA40CST5_9PEZI|nr:S-adenosyl-L-methionine-dependent methyltransferase [Cercophora newfieldiana]